MKLVEKLVTSEAVVNGAYTQKETIATYIGYGGGKNGAEYVIMVRVAAPGKGINLQGNLTRWANFYGYIQLDDWLYENSTKGINMGIALQTMTNELTHVFLLSVGAFLLAMF